MTNPDPATNTATANRKIRVGRALLLFFGLLLAAMIASWPDPLGIIAAIGFPLGLIGVFPEGKHADSYLWLLLAYGSHALFLYLFLTRRQRPVFYLVLAAYAVLLMFNVAGCRQMVKEWEASRPP